MLLISMPDEADEVADTMEADDAPPFVVPRSRS
jgi:hypothetical protein